MRSGWVRSPSPARASLSASCRAFSSASIAEAVLLDTAGEEGRGRDGDFDFAGEAPRGGGVDFAGEAARARAGDFAGRRGEAAAAFFGGMERGVASESDAETCGGVTRYVSRQAAKAGVVRGYHPRCLI